MSKLELGPTRVISTEAPAQSQGHDRHDRDEYDVDWDLALKAAPAVKAPGTRLLDLLSGWSQYAQRDEFPDSSAIDDKICTLYQEAGAFAFDDDTPEQAEAKISEFLTGRVLPVLMSRTED